MLSILHLMIPLSGLIPITSSQMMSMSFPGPQPMQFPGPMSFPAPMQLPGPMPFPAPMPRFMPPMPPPMPRPMPMPMGLGQPKLPVVVMPFYSKHNNPPSRRHKKKRISKKKYRYSSSESCSSETDTDTDFSSSSEVAYRGRKKHKHSRSNGGRRVLTPVLSYVTKDGYVVYQKQIKRERAKNWLQGGRRSGFGHGDDDGIVGNDMSLEDFKREISSRFA